MSADPKILDFIAGAKTKGASEQSLVGILTARGRSEKEIYEALASHYEQATGLSVPHRGGSGTAAKDAFFYLLIFSTLATWTIGLGVLGFTLSTAGAISSLTNRIQFLSSPARGRLRWRPA